MLLNFGKRKFIHIGHGNMDEEYTMGDAVLGRTTQEKDLGVTFCADMKVSEQCGIAASKGNQIIGLIRRTITYKEKQLIVPLYKAIVRPNLEYCIQAFSQRMINEWNKLPNDCVNASSVNMLKNRIDRFDKGGLHIDEKIVGLSISQWLPCPLAIWNYVVWDGNLVKSC